MRKGLTYRWLLRLLKSAICCLLPQFQWITYDVYPIIYHPNLFIAAEHL